MQYIPAGGGINVLLQKETQLQQQGPRVFQVREAHIPTPAVDQDSQEGQIIRLFAKVKKKS